MKRLFWIKVWTEEWLDGSIREQMSCEERAIWIDLLVMAGRSRQPGIIQSNPDTPYTHSHLAGRFKIPVKDLESALKAFETQGRIRENGTGIEIVNWHKYQDARR